MSTPDGVSLAVRLAVHQPRRGRGKSLKSLQLVEAARTVLEEIQPASVRAVCYRLFVMKLIADMSKNSTNKVSTQLTWAREQGLIPWSWIVDETREAERVNAWEDPAAYVETIKRAYRRDRWQDQPEWIEVWSEKGTIRGTIKPILDEYGVTFRVMHGYGSSTAVHEVAAATREAGRMLTVLYVGDWDPSGLHMSEVDLPRRIAEYGGHVQIVRVALTSSDVADPGLPSFAAASKRRDPRYTWYVGRQLAETVLSKRRASVDGLRCWELDALNPNILRTRIEEAIHMRLDLVRWEQAEAAEMAERESLQSILSAWPSISRQDQKYDEAGRG